MKKNSPKIQKSKQLYALLFFVLAVAWVSEIAAEAEANPLATIRVRDRVEIDADEVLLGQIAEIQCSDLRLIQRLKDILVGRAPLPGKSRRYDAGYLQMRLKQHDIDPAAVILEAPECIEVWRSGIKIEKQKIEEIVAGFLRRSIPQVNKNIQVKEIRVSEEVVLPKGQISYKVTPADNQPLMGKRSIGVEFNVNGRDRKKVWASVVIEVLGPVVVTRRPLGRFKPIDENDIEVKTMDLSDLPNDVISDPQAVLGRRTTRVIGAQVPLSASAIELPPLVKRGDLVLIIAESNGLKITTRGQVKRKGRLGEQIPVVNLDSNKILYARIIDANTVQVDF